MPHEGKRKYTKETCAEFGFTPCAASTHDTPDSPARYANRKIDLLEIKPDGDWELTSFDGKRRLSGPRQDLSKALMIWK